MTHHSPIGTLPAVTIHSMECRPTGDAHLVSQAWVHQGCVIEIRGTNDKPIGWIDTHEWLSGLVYRDRLVAAPNEASMSDLVALILSHAQTAASSISAGDASTALNEMRAINVIARQMPVPERRL
jgi:hypothetical protein